MTKSQANALLNLLGKVKVNQKIVYFLLCKYISLCA